MHASPIDEEDLFVFDTAPGAVHEVQQRPAVELDIREIVWRALVIATHDYVHKNGFTDIVIGPVSYTHLDVYKRQSTGLRRSS